MTLYSYTYDINTGGLLLNSSPTGFSKEPRPVYAPELDALGFDQYWKYDKQSEQPYLWAEANCYYYRGKLIARLKGGDIYTAPQIIIPEAEDGSPVMPEPYGMSLRPVNIAAMVEANREMLDIIEQTTVKKILAVYTKHKERLDCFHVAFSGGKDSCVLLDLVKKALPKGSFVVVFGDTGMEFPDTYDAIEKTRQMCEEEEIPFYVARSHLDPKQSWELFGPPSRVLRWCCSVHKSAPQTLKLREITGKDEYTGLAFVGVRAHESATRAEYDYFSDGKKTKGQYSHNSILEWSSAEVWLYIYANAVLINEAYKRGSSRVGCLCCPMGGGRSSRIELQNYTAEVSVYHEKIMKAYGRSYVRDDEYLKRGGWSARKNGRDLADNPINCFERIENEFLAIDVRSPSSDWREWIKTLDLEQGSYSVQEAKTGYTAKLREEIIKQNPLYGRLFRQVFHKAACCQNCGACEANCSNGAIRFVDGKVQINGCIHCQKCHSIACGCLRYHSLCHPKGGENRVKTLNTMSNHAPKTEWLADFFVRGNEFFYDNSLNKKNQLGPFTRFLKDAGLVDENKKVTPFEELVATIGWEAALAQGLILINLVAMNPQVEWYVASLEFGRVYPKKEVVEMLLAAGVELSKSGKPEAHDSICYAFKRLTETPLGTTLRFGFVTDDGDLIRTKCSVSDPRVVLYGLFKFAEKCKDYKEFTLATLLNDSIDRDGISPSRIFGLDRDEMIPILLGLSAKYPEFISASFTHDLEKITLSQDKSSKDVLGLFKGDTANAQ